MCGSGGTGGNKVLKQFRKTALVDGLKDMERNLESRQVERN